MFEKLVDCIEKFAIARQIEQTFFIDGSLSIFALFIYCKVLSNMYFKYVIILIKLIQIIYKNACNKVSLIKLSTILILFK